MDFKAAIILFLLSCAASTAAKADDEMTAGGSIRFALPPIRSRPPRADSTLSASYRDGLGDGTFMDATRKMAERKKTDFLHAGEYAASANGEHRHRHHAATFRCHPTTRNCPPSCQFWRAMNHRFPCRNESPHPRAVLKSNNEMASWYPTRADIMGVLFAVVLLCVVAVAAMWVRSNGPTPVSVPNGIARPCRKASDLHQEASPLKQFGAP